MKSMSLRNRIQQRILGVLENIAQFLQDTPPAVVLTLIIIAGSFIILSTVILFAYLSDTILDQERIFFDNTIMQIVLSFRSPLMTQFIIGISRIYLGVHYPSDVLGGYLAGSLWYATIIVLDRVIVLYRLFREYEKNAYSNKM